MRNRNLTVFAFFFFLQSSHVHPQTHLHLLKRSHFPLCPTWHCAYWLLELKFIFLHIEGDIPEGEVKPRRRGLFEIDPYMFSSPPIEFRIELHKMVRNLQSYEFSAYDMPILGVCFVVCISHKLILLQNCHPVAFLLFLFFRITDAVTFELSIRKLNLIGFTLWWLNRCRSFEARYKKSMELQSFLYWKWFQCMICMALSVIDYLNLQLSLFCLQQYSP